MRKDSTSNRASKPGRCVIRGCKAAGQDWIYPIDGPIPALISVFGWPVFDCYCIPHARKMIPLMFHNAVGVPAKDAPKPARNRGRVAA
jgi:hypothetical protein